MSQATIYFNDIEDAEIREYLCREGESVPESIRRVVLCEVKNKKLQKDLNTK
jgi:hypothetical protein